MRVPLGYPAGRGAPEPVGTEQVGSRGHSGAEQGRAGDRQQPPLMLRSGSWRRLTPGVGLLRAALLPGVGREKAAHARRSSATRTVAPWSVPQRQPIPGSASGQTCCGGRPAAQADRWARARGGEAARALSGVGAGGWRQSSAAVWRKSRVWLVSRPCPGSTHAGVLPCEGASCAVRLVRAEATVSPVCQPRPARTGGLARLGGRGTVRPRARSCVCLAPCPSPSPTARWAWR